MLAYDTGVLTAVERDSRRVWALHRRCLARGILPVVPAAVVAQAWRAGARHGLLMRMLAGCQVEPLDEERARAVGVLASLSEQADIVEVSVVECAIRHQAAVITSNHEPIEQIAQAAGVQVPIAQL